MVSASHVETVQASNALCLPPSVSLVTIKQINVHLLADLTYASFEGSRLSDLSLSPVVGDLSLLAEIRNLQN